MHRFLQALSEIHQTKPNLFGGTDTVGIDGQVLHHTQPNVFGGMDHYDSLLNHVGHTEPALGGGEIHHGLTDGFDADHLAGLSDI